MTLRKAAVLAAVLCIAVSSLVPHCQAIPLQSDWSDESLFAWEEGVVRDAATRVSSELEALIQQKQASEFDVLIRKQQAEGKFVLHSLCYI